MSRRSRFDARYWMLGAGALGRPRGMVWGGRREEGSGWGARVYLWRIHFDIWQNQYNIVNLKIKIKFKKLTTKKNLKKKKKRCLNISYHLGNFKFFSSSVRAMMRKTKYIFLIVNHSIPGGDPGRTTLMTTHP